MRKFDAHYVGCQDMPSHVCAEEGATALQTPADVAVGPVSQAESGGTPEPEKAEETADASAVSDGSVTYTFAADDKSIQEKAARFLADIKARLSGDK